MFINRGRIVLDTSMEEFESRYTEVQVRAGQLSSARALKPMSERQTLDRTLLIFDGVDRTQLAVLGDMRTPSIADLFVAVMANQPQKNGAAQ
jgi:ABC-2 type transport system ATP-binding protein